MSPPQTVRDAPTQSYQEARRGRTVRRLVVALMVVFVGAGLLGVLGYRAGAVAEIRGGFALEVTYPQVTRGGLPSNWELRLRRVDGGELPSTFAIRSSSGYLGRFDENGFDPEPASTWAEGDDVIWTFEPPPGSTELVVSFDARWQPNARGWFDGHSALLVDGDEVVSVSYRTWGVP